MIRISIFLGSVLCLLTAGCAVGVRRSADMPATLSFAKVGTTPGFLGSFRTLDGRPIPGTPLVVELAPGFHRVGYWCPDHLVLDGPPTVAATFKAGRSYVLHCKGNEDGRVEER